MSTNRKKRADAYFICATPRTGSSLLLGLLESTGVAGRPEAYFREPDEQLWADRWGLNPTDDGRVDYGEYVRAALAAGRTDNGVFGAKLMWGTLDEVVEKLAAVYPDDAGPEAEADLALLNRAFGEIRFVYLRREDVVAQAASWLRAEQTGTWYIGDPTPGAGTEEPHFDAASIQEYEECIAQHNAAWEQWFSTCAIEPFVALYEELCADMVGVTRGVLDFLQLDLPAGRDIVARHQRQRDGLSAQWIDRYRAESASRRGVPT